MIEVENTDVNIVRNLIPMRNHMPASAYGLKAISDWFVQNSLSQNHLIDFTKNTIYDLVNANGFIGNESILMHLILTLFLRRFV